MLWTLLDSSRGWFEVWLSSDILYIGSLIILVCGLCRNAKKQENGWLFLLLAWIMVMQCFLLRFTLILPTTNGKENYSKTIALTRSVLHTLIVPLAITIIWAVFRLIREQVAGYRKWWQTGLWLAWIVFAVVWCVGLVYFMYTHFGTYTPLGHYHGEHSGYP